ncbi:fimbrillin family protein [Parabacteroides sp. PF5-9]|uniref:fimbrillin family protein n=1 Tax=Parabacteroides sp. PF5-9 TaxID=1742404 RepID=UPI002475E3B3|nr:fimbrillin family protein [Parabacteroides sp. PF5-9]MDH6357860.1 hypothetical protein [Parabacteroides sp. PF5-9]
MKRSIYTILIFLTTTLLWTACSDHTDIDLPVERQISFACDAIASRVQETTGGTIATFRVSSGWTRPSGDWVSLMDGQYVEKRGINWYYSPASVMPASGTVDFFAYSPANASIIDYNHYGPLRDQVELIYDVTNDPLIQHDFMVAEALEQTESTISLNFQHMLSSVTVEAKSIISGYVFRIHEVKFYELKRRGVLSGTTSSSPKTTTWWWNGQSGIADYTVYQKGAVDVADTYKPITDAAVGPLMVLPQSELGDSFVFLDLELFDTSGNLINSRGIIAIPYTKDFEMGKKYTFRIQLSPDLLRSSGEHPGFSATLEVIAEDR